MLPNDSERAPTPRWAAILFVSWWVLMAVCALPPQLRDRLPSEVVRPWRATKSVVRTMGLLPGAPVFSGRTPRSAMRWARVSCCIEVVGTTKTARRPAAVATTQFPSSCRPLAIQPLRTTATNRLQRTFCRTRKFDTEWFSWPPRRDERNRALAWLCADSTLKTVQIREKTRWIGLHDSSRHERVTEHGAFACGDYR